MKTINPVYIIRERKLLGFLITESLVAVRQVMCPSYLNGGWRTIAQIALT